MRLYSIFVIFLNYSLYVSCKLDNFIVEVNDFENEANKTIRYKPDWNDLDRRPLPRWYDKAKIGIFLHWGVYAVPGFGSEWFWMSWKTGSKPYKDYMKRVYSPNFSYQDFAPMFTAEFFDPNEWAALFFRSGARYVVLTSKHHEGFTLFPSKKSFSWNSVDVGPKRDIVQELSLAVRKAGLKFGVYHSLLEWFNPIYLEDKKKLFTIREFPDNKVWPDIKQLVNDYKPSVLWSDGDWEAFDTYWKSKELLAWLYNDSPVKDEIVVNDRWGIGIPGKHGDFYNHADRFNPGKLMKHKWENAFTIDSQSWGWRKQLNIKDILSIQDLLYQVVSTVSCGGNALINIGPTKEGTIDPIFQERLLQLGHWLQTNAEAIYDTSPWISQNDTLTGTTWYTCLKPDSDYEQELNPIAPPKDPKNVERVYAIFLQWPVDGVLKLNDITQFIDKDIAVTLLGLDGEVKYTINGKTTSVILPERNKVKTDYAWTLMFADRNGLFEPENT